MTSSVTNCSHDELAAWIAAAGQPAFRADQIREWVYDKWIEDFDEMRNVPKALRCQLAESFRCTSVRLTERRVATDRTVKFLAELGDGEAVETVLIPAPERTTVCISTQVGCPVRCAFCASGRFGLTRNLERGEIVDQVRMACRTLGRRVDNVVVMGVGEPLLNLDAVIPALEDVCSSDRLGISARRVTVSTSGIVPGIRRLAHAGYPWNLAVSLHAPRDRDRAELIPPQYRYPLRDILGACRAYQNESHRKITLEYALVAGRNDRLDDAKSLANIAAGLHAKVNLIPCNPVGSRHLPPPSERVHAFCSVLSQAGVQATVRREKGRDVDAACGQLRAHAAV